MMIPMTRPTPLLSLSWNSVCSPVPIPLDTVLVSSYRVLAWMGESVGSGSVTEMERGLTILLLFGNISI